MVDASIIVLVVNTLGEKIRSSVEDMGQYDRRLWKKEIQGLYRQERKAIW